MVARKAAMKSDNQNKKKIGTKRVSAFTQIERVQPVKMLLYLCLGGIGVMFLIFMLAYGRTEAYTLEKLRIPFPRFFSVSTLLLLASSLTLARISKLYAKDKVAKMGRFLGYTLALTLLFIGSQLLGWSELAGNGVYFRGKPFGSYLYLITGLHVLHVAAGLLFLTYLYFRVLYTNRDAIRTLIFIRDPFRKMQLGMLTTYWHFLGGLWLGLYLFFLFML